MLPGQQLWEPLSYDLSKPWGHFRNGQWVDGRNTLLDVLRKHGFDLGNAGPMDEHALSERSPHWLVVLGMSMDEGYSLHVVPEGALDDQLRAAIDHCDGKAITHAAAWEDPTTYAAYSKIALAAGRKEAQDCEPLEEELARELDFTAESLPTFVDRWHGCEASPFGDKELLNTRITRVVHIFEWL